MRLWEWRPGTPLGLDGDSGSVTVWVRTIIEFGPYADNPSLGAPFAQNLGWFPTGDDVHFAILWMLGRVSHDAFTVTAIYFFVGFLLAALTMYWLARTERLSTGASIVVGVLFAVLPGHQVRFPHLFLAAYWVLPLGAWVALRLFRGHSVFRAGPGDGWGAERPRLWAFRAALILLVVALGGVYYAAFSLILICSALALRLIGEYQREHLYRGLRVVASIAGLSVFSLLGMHARTLRDQVVGSPPLGRSPAESEYFGGKIVDLVLPWPDHRVPLLGNVARWYDAATQPTAEPSALGVVALVGCIIAIVVVLTSMVSPRSWSRHQPEFWAYGVLALVALAFYTKDGLGAVFALFVAPEIRTWLRLYVVIGMFGLLALGRVVTVLGARLGNRWATLACALVVVIGVLDQTSPGAAPDYASNRQRLASISALTGQLESRLEPGCAVFQVPIVRFPGSKPLVKLRDYDLELPYLASTQLRWSYGAIGGTTQAEWQQRLPNDPPSLLDDLEPRTSAPFKWMGTDDDPTVILDQMSTESVPG